MDDYKDYCGSQYKANRAGRRAAPGYERYQRYIEEIIESAISK
jgi:hypothetical protein